MELVTGYRGMNHVTAEQLADLQAGVLGYDSCVLNIGEKLRADVVTSNKIRIFDGVFIFNGKQAMIEAGDYEDITIENGTIGLYRNDIIVVDYKKDEATGIENTTLKVLKGNTADEATDPVYTTNDIRAGAFESEIPLYRVKLNGLAIEKVEPLYTVAENLASLNISLANNISELNDNLSKVTTINVTKGEKFQNGSTYVCVKNGVCYVTIELTPSIAVANNDIVLTGLPEPRTNEAMYLSLPLANGNSYSAAIKSDGKLVIYYPHYTTVERIDTSFSYLIKS